MLFCTKAFSDEEYCKGLITFFYCSKRKCIEMGNNQLKVDAQYLNCRCYSEDRSLQILSNLLNISKNSRVMQSFENCSMEILILA